MRHITRVIIVRPGETSLFECLRKRFGDDPGTVVIYDRRRAPRSGAAEPPDAGDQGRQGERRWPQEHDILSERGFYVSRGRTPRQA